jgi:serine/threonine protein kinase
VGRYKIERRMGAGGMGVVYQARDSGLGRLVGLKLVLAHRDANAAADRLLREARAMAGISHPNVLTVYDVGEYEGRLYYAMELMEGGTLREWLEQKVRSPREVAQVMMQAARGLAAAHAAGLVHHDFKPDNVLVGSDGSVRVADFGLVRMASPVKPRPAAVVDEAEPPPLDGNLIIGTPGYMAPEQLLGEPTDARTDQFSFCVTLCEALYGESPFKGEIATDVETRVVVMKAVLAGEITLPQGRPVPAWLRRIILRGLSVDPAARWPSLDAVAHLIDRGLHRRRRLGTAAAAATLVAASIALTVWGLRDTKPASEWRPEVIGIESEGNPARLGAISRDGKVLAFSSRREVWTQHRGTVERVPVRLPEGSYDIFNLALSPGGERLFIILARLNVRESELWRIELPAGEPEQLYAPPRVRLGYFDVAPDGRTLALVEMDERGDFRLLLVGPDGSLRTLVEPVPGEALTSPAFSPDGRRVAFVRSGPSPAAGAEWVDVDGGRRTRVGPAAQEGVLDWSGPNVLLVPRVGRDDITRVRELTVDDQGRIRRERDVYSLPADVILWRIQATAAGVFMQRGPLDGRPRVAVLPLGAEAPKLRVLPTGSEEDFHAAGFTSNGDIVIAARAAAQESLLVGSKERGFKSAGSLRELGRPLWVIGDRVFYRQPGDDANSVTLAVGELSQPPTRVARLKPSDQIFCAATNREPCILAEIAGNETVAFEWDTRTGARGREILRWVGYYPGAGALSADGKTVAYVTPRGAVGTVTRAGERADLTAPSAFTFHDLAWTPDGALLATRCCAPYALVRIDARGQTVLAETGTQRIANPVVSPDGATVALSVAETQHTYLFVPAQK